MVTSATHSVHFPDTPNSADSGILSSSPWDVVVPSGFGMVGHDSGSERSRFPFPEVSCEEVSRGKVPSVRAKLVRPANAVRNTYSTVTPASSRPTRQPIQFRNTDVR